MERFSPFYVYSLFLKLRLYSLNIKCFFCCQSLQTSWPYKTLFFPYSLLFLILLFPSFFELFYGQFVLFLGPSVRLGKFWRRRSSSTTKAQRSVWMSGLGEGGGGGITPFPPQNT